MIQLVSTPDNWRAPYGKDKSLVPVPARMRWLHPAALASWIDTKFSPDSGPVDSAPELIVTDVYRSLVSQLEAYESGKRGVQRPGYSAHNFGLAIDLDVKAMMKLLDCDKAELDLWMDDRNWRCYRDDHKLGPESWHYSFDAVLPGSKAVEGTIQNRFEGEFTAMRAPENTQAALAKLKLYNGDIDGKLGPISRRAIQVFQRQWKLSVDGKVGPETARMLVAAVLV